MSNRTVRLAAATLSVGVLLAPIMASSAEAATTRLYNSVHSNQNIGSWADDHCGGRLHQIAPGHSRTGVGSFKVYGDGAVLIKSTGKRQSILKRHCYKAAGIAWEKIKVTGD